MEENINSKRKGSFLECVIQKLFCYAGFKTILNPRYDNQLLSKKEIDVEANYLGKRILISCKQYEKAAIPISDLILQSAGLKDILKADAFILVLWGYPVIKDKDDKLAEASKIALWNDLRIITLFDTIFEKKEKAKAEILSQIGIDIIEAKEYEKKLLQEYDINLKEIKKLIKKELKERKEGSKDRDKRQKEFLDNRDEIDPRLRVTDRYITLNCDTLLGNWIKELWMQEKPILYEKFKDYINKNSIFIDFSPDYRKIHLLIKMGSFGHIVKEKNPEEWWKKYKISKAIANHSNSHRFFNDLLIRK